MKVLWLLGATGLSGYLGEVLGKHFRGDGLALGDDGLVLGPRHVPEGYAVFV